MLKYKVIFVFSFLFLISAPNLYGDTVNRVKLVEKIKLVVQDEFCFMNYWFEENYISGTPLAFKLDVDGDDFAMQIADAEVNKRLKLVVFIKGKILDSMPVVISFSGYNILTDIVKSKDYKDMLSMFDRNYIRGNITIPIDCTPKFGESSKAKELMINTIVKTMKKLLFSSEATSVKKPRRKVKIVISNFNKNYPSTYVYLEKERELYLITLHDISNLYSNRYEKIGEYPITKIGNKWPENSSIVEKIKKHGIVKIIE